MDSSKKMDPPAPLQTVQQKANPDRGAGVSIYVPEQGGYKEKFVKPVEDKYKCEKCHLILCNPKQTECGHRFCETCMHILLSAPSPKCTACQENIIKDKVFKDNCCKREILALQIYCRNESKGCTEQLTLGHLLVHLKSDCQFEELSCIRTDCKEKILRKDLPGHVEKSCKYREATCQYCKSQVPMITLQKHEDTDCPCVVVSCPHKCSVQTLLRSELNAHLSECINAPSTCSFKRYGCTFQGTNQQIKTHEASSAVQHVNLLKEWSNSLEKKRRSLREADLPREVTASQCQSQYSSPRFQTRLRTTSLLALSQSGFYSEHYTDMYPYFHFLFFIKCIGLRVTYICNYFYPNTESKLCSFHFVTLVSPAR